MLIRELYVYTCTLDFFTAATNLPALVLLQYILVLLENSNKILTDVEMTDCS